MNPLLRLFFSLIDIAKVPSKVATQIYNFSAVLRVLIVLIHPNTLYYQAILFPLLSNKKIQWYFNTK